MGINEEIAPIAIHNISRLFLFNLDDNEDPRTLAIITLQKIAMLIIVAESLISGISRITMSLTLKTKKYHTNALNNRKNFAQKPLKFDNFEEPFSSILDNLNAYPIITLANPFCRRVQQDLY